ncbi:hypothetical protein BD309DRAFT_994254 [Dichomitus squalens]|nr:hypothetical protein BD309DRAFT_994254 [Dichomitus squalens]
MSKNRVSTSVPPSPPYFHPATGDLIVRLADSIDFHVHQCTIANVSLVFADMFYQASGGLLRVHCLLDAHPLLLLLPPLLRLHRGLAPYGLDLPADFLAVSNFDRITAHVHHRLLSTAGGPSNASAEGQAAGFGLAGHHNMSYFVGEAWRQGREALRKVWLFDSGLVPYLIQLSSRFFW